MTGFKLVRATPCGGSNCESAAAILRIRELHRKETRWGNDDWSMTEGEYAEDGGAEEWPNLEAFDVCIECCRIEMSPEQRDPMDDIRVLEGLYPCPTIRALDGEATK